MVGARDGEEIEESGGRRRRGEEERDTAAEAEAGAGAGDPMAVLGPDIMWKVMGLLDAGSVARCIVVSQWWYEIAAADRVWAPKCEELRKGKAHIPRSPQVRGASRLAAYSISIMDGKRCLMFAFWIQQAQARIVKEDLCDHVWEFHFREAAPEYWRNLDPFWNGTAPPMRRYFNLDGSQTADPHDEVWGGHECTYCIVTSYVGDGQIRNHYVRINRWPGMRVSRKEDWSWEMSNNLYCYNSVPDAEKDGGTGPLFFPVWGQLHTAIITRGKMQLRSIYYYLLL
ncbi:uncharacterized protein LOC109714552 isoform X1 [Ananas comosus]|uniref:Uncharacterized protein LOC109714552 isoform X1 n=2 Tax=Ananas comosus TaxID=4615 RepID=A0A6P5FGW2_ANACO|nr:uncharacterized protein LOC109714552 isoform X1 [Ananas comosus]XP_020094818.1 uncharacterized protein LOC109714552 isoform X1 [Ananas comosus]